MVAIIHGVGEHSGRYDYVAQHLVAHGFAVAALDLRGHGESEGRRVYIDRYTDFVGDITQWIGAVTVRLHSTQMFILGHSAGGLLALKYLLDGHRSVDGLILSGAAVKINEDMSPLLQCLSGIIASVVPRMRTIKLNANLISRDPTVVQEYMRDPLVYTGGLPARYGHLVLQTTREVQEKFHELKLPLLILHGGSDRLVYPEASWSLFSNCGSDDKSIRIYEGLFHEIFNEPERDKIIVDVINWLKVRLIHPNHDDQDPT